jgi:membrane fusion protein (multidrug efflux system)
MTRPNVRRQARRAIPAWRFIVVIAAVTLQPVTGFAQPPGVIVTRVTELPFPLTVEALGTLRANESVEIRAQINEVVAAIRFNEGQWIRAGAAIVELNATEAKAAVAGARAALAESDSRHQRSLQLFEQNLISTSELEPVEARRDGDKAALDAAEARLAETVLRAPFAGRLGLRRVSVGGLVGPNDVITTLDDTGTMKLDFEVPETALARLSTGLPVAATSAAYPDSQFRGRVVSIDTRVDPVSRTLTVRAVLPNAQGLLRPGMFMSVRLMREDIRALLIPEQALMPEQNRMFVWAIGAEQKAEKREVRIGRRRPGAVEILSGLAAGETVIVEGTQKARAGQPVEILERRPMAP